MTETTTTPYAGPSPRATQTRALATGKPRLALAVAELSMLWRNEIRFVSAFVIAAFPLIFMYDEAADLAFSPVLPGLLLLVIVLVAVPPLMVELRTRRIRDLDHARTRILRSVQTSWACVGLAVIWLVFWFSGVL